ncbi:MAG: hypothetical protein ACHBNF_09870 [Chromatiales bacterium]
MKLRLSYIGIATNISAGVGRFYWLLMVPVFAAVILLSQWVRLRGHEVHMLPCPATFPRVDLLDTSGPRD